MEYPGSRVGKRKQKKPGKNRSGTGRVWLLLVLVLCGICFTAPLVLPSGKHMDPSEYFRRKMAEGGSEEDLTGQPGAETPAVVLQDHVDPRIGIRTTEALYFNYNMVNEAVNERFFWDEESRTMLFTTPEELFEIPSGGAVYTVEGEERTYQHDIVICTDDKVYLSAAFVGDYTNMEYTEGEDGVHVFVKYRWGSTLTAEVKKKSAMRLEADKKSPIITELNEGDRVTVLTEEGKWTLAVSPDGFIGYIRNRYLNPSEELEINREFKEPEYTSIHSDKKIRMVWHAVDSMESNGFLEQDMGSMSGINVISPTWFSLADEEGNIASLADEAYVKKAHEKNLQVWGLLYNFNSDISTYAVVKKRSSRKTLEEALLKEALTYKLDGINIDLEMITEDSAPGYVQLIRELSILCRKNRLVLSVDIPVPMPFNLYYNRKELGTTADYVIMMGYDEHYHGSEAGSVASLSYEENGIKESLNSVPKEKLISGIPFYTRIWYTWTAEDGSVGTESEVLPMYKISEYLPSEGAVITWDEDTQQNLASWTDSDGTRCRIWIEDAASLALKAELVNEYDLGGFAAWVLGNETPNIWELLEKTVEG